MFAAKSVLSQRVVLLVPEADAVAAHVGYNPHLGEEPVLVGELAGVVGRLDGHHPGVSLVDVMLQERLAVDAADVQCASAVSGVMAPDLHADLEVVHVDGLGVEWTPLHPHS